MIYQTLLRHRELPVMPMIPRISRASIPSQTVMPCNLTLTILSVGPNHLGSYYQSKCKYQCITRPKSPVQPTYVINETPLEFCDTEKDFGVWVSSNLTSDKQVTEQYSKANKLLGFFVRRASRYIQNTQRRRTLYLSIVRCHLGYATQVWSPQSIGLLNRVENVARRATKLILKLPFRSDVRPASN